MNCCANRLDALDQSALAANATAASGKHGNKVDFMHIDCTRMCCAHVHVHVHLWLHMHVYVCMRAHEVYCRVLDGAGCVYGSK
jgi:hypothetical protein